MTFHILSPSELKITNWLNMKIVWMNSPVHQLTVFAIGHWIYLKASILGIIIALIHCYCFHDQFYAKMSVFVVLIYKWLDQKVWNQYSNSPVYQQRAYQKCRIFNNLLWFCKHLYISGKLGDFLAQGHIQVWFLSGFLIRPYPIALKADRIGMFTKSIAEVAFVIRMYFRDTLDTFHWKAKT